MAIDNDSRMGTVLRKVTETRELYVQLAGRKGGRHLVIATREFYGPGRYLNGWMAIKAESFDGLERVRMLLEEVLKTALHMPLDGSKPIEFFCEYQTSDNEGETQQLRVLVSERDDYRNVTLRLYNKVGNSWCWGEEECVLGVSEICQISAAIEFGTEWDVEGFTFN